MAIHVVNEARRCLHCKKPMCREGCPISTNIPEAIEATKKKPVKCCTRITR